MTHQAQATGNPSQHWRAGVSQPSGTYPKTFSKQLLGAGHHGQAPGDPHMTAAGTLPWACTDGA